MTSADDLKKLADDLTLTSIKRVAALYDNSELANYDSYDAFIDDLEAQGISALTAKMNEGAPYYWFPSGWRDTPWGKPYPKILAKALVASQDNESMTDITNVYYGGRSLSPEALEVFKADVLAKPQEVIKHMTTEFLPNGLEGLAQHDLSFLKSMLMLLSEDELKAHVEAVKTYMRPAAAEKYFSFVELSP